MQETFWLVNQTTANWNMLKERHTHRLNDIRVYIRPNNQTFAQNMTTIRSFAFKTVKRSYTLLSPNCSFADAEWNKIQGFPIISVVRPCMKRQFPSVYRLKRNWNDNYAKMCRFHISWRALHKNIIYLYFRDEGGVGFGGWGCSFFFIKPY